MKRDGQIIIPARTTVSIGIPVFDRTRFISEAIQSCLEQEYAATEIIISDDSRHDGIERICRSFPQDKVQYIRRDSPFPLIDKLNDLLDKASGDWLLLLGDDDSLDPGFIKHMMQLAIARPEATLLRSRYRLVDASGKTIRVEDSLPVHMTSLDFLERIFQPGYKMNIAGIMFPRLLLKSLGGFTALPTLWDSDRIAWSKLAVRGPCMCDPQALCNLRVHTNAESVRFIADYEAMIQTSQGVNSEIHSSLDSLSTQIKSDEDQRAVTRIRQFLDSYTHKQLIRALDQGMFCVVEDNPDGAARKLEPILRLQKALGLGTFLSAYVYRILSHVPYALRKPVLRRYKQYKLAKSMR